MTYFTYFFLDKEKDIIVNLYRDKDRLFYVLETPNHASGNLIRNLAKLCELPVSLNENGLLVIPGEIPCYVDGNNRDVYIMRLANTKIANIYPDKRVEMKASIPSIAKTFMSQTKDYTLDAAKTIFKTYIPKKYKFRSDLHTHMNGNLKPDILIALGIEHQIRYPYYYVKKLDLKLSDTQLEAVLMRREKVAKQFVDSPLKGKYLERRINDNTFINFADLILNNLDNAEENIVKIRTSLAVLKDGQAVFTNLEKVYLYRYVFCKGKESESRIKLHSLEMIPDRDVRNYLLRMEDDRENPDFSDNTLYKDLLLWIARTYQANGVIYAEISDTTLVKKYESLAMLREVHEVMPAIYRETGVMIRFLAAMRRIPLTIVKDAVTPEDYLNQNLRVLRAVAYDPYVAGCDFVGEEINDIIELKPLINEIVKIAAVIPGFVIRIHAGENDSLKDNISHSIECVTDSLAPGQNMPHMRIGHGLYTYGLTTIKGKKILKALKENDIILEFQLSSNVRLNNLSTLSNHPLKQYLAAGVSCVQGTDGGALYGTDSIDEQLSLEKLLDLSEEDMMKMRNAEDRVIDESMEDYSRKKIIFKNMLKSHDMESVLLSLMENDDSAGNVKLDTGRKYDSNTELSNRIVELPWDKLPVVVCGGSFNTEKRVTRVSAEGINQLQELMDSLDPEETFFVIGYRLQGYEKYLVDHNDRRFQIFAFVPKKITSSEKNKLINSGVYIRVSTESEGMGIYKSFNYEIFERRPSVVAGFDGNSAAANLIQEAKNGKGSAGIFIFDKAKNLQIKAHTLTGYVQSFGESSLTELVRKFTSSLRN